MQYAKTVHAKFLNRPNRFIAKVLLDGKEETVHVKNTARCRELLLPGSHVILETAVNPARKTKYDLVSVFHDSLGWINIDSQAPNQVVKEWLLSKKDVKNLKPEYVYGDSRIDFYFEKENDKVLLEVKGVTLEKEGACYFPDAPTLRGIKHLEELIKAKKEGYTCFIAFVIQINGIHIVYPNDETHKEFGETLRKAEKAGVGILYLSCFVSEDEIYIVEAKEKLSK